MYLPSYLVGAHPESPGFSSWKYIVYPQSSTHPWLTMEEFDDYYEEEEEEETQFFPLSDEFCDAVDSSILKAVSDAVAPLEKKLDDLAKRLQPLSEREDVAGPSGPLPPQSSSASLPEKPRKRPRSDGVDSNALEKLRQAFLDAQTPAQPVEPSSSEPLPSGTPRLIPSPPPSEDLHGGSDGESEKSRSWRPSPPGSVSHLQTTPSQADLQSDLLDPENLLHPRSSQWVPCDKVAKYVAGRLRKPLDQEDRSRGVPSPILVRQSGSYTGN